MAKLDGWIEADLEKYVDGPVRQRIQEMKDDLAMWVTAREVIQDGTFTRQEQAIFSKMFGPAMLEKLKDFLREMAASEVEEAVQRRLEAAREDLENTIPDSFEAEVRKIEERISTGFAAR